MNDSPESVPLRRHLEAAMILAVVASIVYSNSFSAGFVFDNAALILKDPRGHGLSLEHFKAILGTTYWWGVYESGLYRPLTTLSYLFNYRVLGNGPNPVGYHIVNLILHAANTFLVYLLTLRLLRKYRLAILAAVIWTVHPLATEAVTNIIGRADEMAAFGVLSAVLLYIRSTHAQGRRKLALLGGMMLAIFTAVFSKENGVVAVALIVLYDLVYRLPSGIPWREQWQRVRGFMEDGYVYAAMPLLVMFAVRREILRHAGAMEIQFTDNPITRAGFFPGRLTALEVIGRYTWKLVWPQTLSCDYSYNAIPIFQPGSAHWDAWAALATCLAVTALAIFFFRRSRNAFFAFAWGALALLPVSNLVIVSGTIMADRLLYLPGVGFAIFLVLAIDRIVALFSGTPVVAAAAICLIGAAYGARSYQRNFDWTDDRTLQEAATDAVPAGYKAHMALAQSIFAADPKFHDGDAAIVEAEKAFAIVEKLPDDRSPTNLYVIVSGLYLIRGDTIAPIDATGNPQADPRSLPWYRKALATAVRGVSVDRAQNERHRLAELARGASPNQIGLVGMVDVYNNLGYAYLRIGDPQTALQVFQDERRHDRGKARAYVNLSLAFAALGRLQEARAALHESLLIATPAASLPRLKQLYDSAEGGNCAIDGSGDHLSVNPSCPLVQQDLCLAYRDLAAAVQESDTEDVAGHWREASRGVSGCIIP